MVPVSAGQMVKLRLPSTRESEVPFLRGRARGRSVWRLSGVVMRLSQITLTVLSPSLKFLIWRLALRLNSKMRRTRVALRVRALTFVDRFLTFRLVVLTVTRRLMKDIVIVMSLIMFIVIRLLSWVIRLVVFFLTVVRQKPLNRWGTFLLLLVSLILNPSCVLACFTFHPRVRRGWFRVKCFFNLRNS